MILHCNQNTVYVLNTSYTSYGVSSVCSTWYTRIDISKMH